MWDKIKEHPWIVGGVIGVFILVLVFSSSSSSSSGGAQAATTGDPNGDQLAAYMAQLNQQGQIAQLSATASAQQTEAAVTVAKLQSGSTDTANTLAAQVAEFQSNLAANVAQSQIAAGVTHDTLSAQVQENQIQAGVQNTQIVANALTTEQQIASNTQIAQIKASSDVQQSWIHTLPTIINEQGNTAVQVAQAQRPCSSYLFGLISDC
jgi:hypothetical protein